MKKGKKFIFKNLSLLFVLLVLQTGALAKEYKSKVIKKTLDASPNIEVLHKHGLLEVDASTDGKVHFEAVMTFDAKSESDAQTLFDHFDVNISEGGNKLVLETIFEVKNWNQTFGTVKIKFKDGAKAKNINGLKISMLVKLPAAEYLKFKNKYNKIVIKHSLDANVEVVLYEGTLEAKDINGNLTLATKYSRINMGNYENAAIELYECTLHIGNGKNVKMNAKYSKVYMGSTRNFSLTAYEGKGEIGLIKGKLTLNAKYCHLSIDNFKQANVVMYEGSFTAKKGIELAGEAKYTPITIGSIDELKFKSTYETDIDVKKLGSLSTENSKYSKFNIGSLSGKIEAKTYEGRINVHQVESTFGGIDLESKYTNLKMSIPKGLKYNLEVDLQYTSIDYNQEDFESSLYKEKNNKIEIKSKVRGATANAPLVKIIAYEGKVALN